MAAVFVLAGAARVLVGAACVRVGAACVLVGAACVLVGAACGPRVNPEGPGAGPDEVVERAAPGAARARPPMREMLIGEMCPNGAAGRPAVMPLFLRAVTWSDNGEEVSTAIERRRARQFSVLGWDGRRAGIFSVAGAAEVGRERKAAVGAYAGESPCARANQTRRGKRMPGDFAACIKSQAHCGLALAVLEPNGGGAAPFEEDPDPASFPVSGACVAGDKLIVDIDGDGAEEAYPVAAFLDPVRAPAEEVSAVPRGKDRCKPTFSARRVLPPSAPKRWRGRNLHHWLGLDLLGVIDIDGDSRREIVVSYHYADRRTWAVYSALSTVGRLDLVGEAIPWPR